MLVYLSCGQCGPILWLCLCWHQVDSCWAKRSEKWEQQEKHCKTKDILMVGGYLRAMLAHPGAMLAYLEGNVGPSWGYVGPSWGYVGPSWGYVGPSWGYVGPSWGYVGPSWGLCWPILGLCWPILKPMLAHVDPSAATKSEKWEKMGRAQNTVKRGTFWRPGWSAARGGGPSLLRRGENCRTARTRPGGPWPDYWCKIAIYRYRYLSAYAQQPARGPTMGAVAADVGVVGLAGTKTG